MVAFLRSSQAALARSSRFGNGLVKSQLSRNFSNTAFTMNSASQQNVVKKSSLFRRISKAAVTAALVTAIGATGYVALTLYREAHPPAQIKQSATNSNGAPKKTLVILGSGWGSISLLKNLDSSAYNVVLVSPRNYFLYTPLLPSTPVGTVEAKSIVEPVRAISRRLSGEVVYYEAEAESVDVANKTLKLKTCESEGEASEMTLKYDYLVVGVGAQPNTFGTPGVYEYGSFLKEIPDAQDIRSKMMNCISKAALLPVGDSERNRLLHFVVVGGGPTGVEFAAELKDYVDQDLVKWIPEMSKEIKVSLIEASPNVLGMFDKSLIDYAKNLFQEEKIDLKLKTAVKKVDEKTVTMKCGDDIEEIGYGVLVWATGNAPREISKKLMNDLPEQNSRRGLLINEKLQLLGGNGSIFALGDCTFYPGLFPTAQVAHQEGCYLADQFAKLNKIDQLKWEADTAHDAVLKQKLQQKVNVLESKMEDFKYHHMGALAYIGAEKAIADLAVGESKYRLSGSFTYLFWKYAYLSMCLSARNKVLIVIDWIKVSIIGRNSSV